MQRILAGLAVLVVVAQADAEYRTVLVQIKQDADKRSSIAIHSDEKTGVEKAFHREKGDPNWTVDEELAHELFGKGMFDKGVANTRHSPNAVAGYQGKVKEGLTVTRDLTLTSEEKLDAIQERLDKLEKNLTAWRRSPAADDPPGESPAVFPRSRTPGECPKPNDKGA
jgi:hypothetical protein